LGTFSVVSLFLMVLIGFVLTWVIQQHLEQAALLQEAESAADQVSAILQPNLRLADFSGPLDVTRYAEVDALIRQNLLRSQHIVRVKIWTQDGLLLYSDERDLAGRYFAVDEDLKEALSGKVAMQVSSLQKDENVAEQGQWSRLLEVYVPLRLAETSQVAGAYEIYHDLASIEPHMAELRLSIWGSVGLGFLILYGSLFTLVRGASLRLFRSDQENARLYQETKQQLVQLEQHRQEQEAIITMATALRMAPDRAAMPPVVLSQLRALLQTDGAALETLVPATGELIIELGIGIWALVTGERIPPGQGLSAQVIATGRPYRNNAVASDPHLFRPDLIGECQAAAGVPLIAQGQIIGLLWIARRAAITDLEFRLLAAIGDMTANAMHRASLHEQTVRLADDLALAYDTTLEGWVRALDLRDQETEGHSLRVAEMSVRLGRSWGLNEADLVQIRRGALLHDIGKMAISDRILLKPGPLSEEEWVIMRRHPDYAYQLLLPVTYLRPAIEIPYGHHEKWDGSGYPRGLKGEQIHLAARLFAVIDVYDALRSDRPYRSAWPEDRVLAHVQSLAGTHFDPDVVQSFLALQGGYVALDANHNPAALVSAGATGHPDGQPETVSLIHARTGNHG
jgi:putative nucleotidyltransferase with HDIG domain